MALLRVRGRAREDRSREDGGATLYVRRYLFANILAQRTTGKIGFHSTLTTHLALQHCYGRCYFMTLYWNFQRSSDETVYFSLKSENWFCDGYQYIANLIGRLYSVRAYFVKTFDRSIPTTLIETNFLTNLHNAEFILIKKLKWLCSFPLNNNTI